MQIKSTKLKWKLHQVDILTIYTYMYYANMLQTVQIGYYVLNYKNKLCERCVSAISAAVTSCSP